MQGVLCVCGGVEAGALSRVQGVLCVYVGWRLEHCTGCMQGVCLGGGGGRITVQGACRCIVCMRGRGGGASYRMHARCVMWVCVWGGFLQDACRVGGAVCFVGWAAPSMTSRCACFISERDGERACVGRGSCSAEWPHCLGLAPPPPPCSTMPLPRRYRLRPWSPCCFKGWLRSLTRTASAGTWSRSLRRAHPPACRSGPASSGGEDRRRRWVRVGVSTG